MGVPMKRPLVLTAQVNVRLKPELRDRIKALSAKGYDMNAVLREWIEKGVLFAEGEDAKKAGN